MMTPHYTPKELPFRENQIGKMASVLGVALRGQKPDNLFLYGKTGTGKTATTRHVLEQLDEAAKKSDAMVKVIYMNCRTYNSRYKAMYKAVKEFYPDKDFMGYSASFIYEKMGEFIESNGAQTIVALDEIDKVKDVDELVYTMTRINDELNSGSLSIIGISNQITFKDRLDPRTKSSLCEHEIVFPPYNAEELQAILKQRIALAFKEGVVEDSAVNLAAAIAAQESGDARTAVMLMLRAGEIAESEGKQTVNDDDVKKAKKSVEHEIIYDMISTLPQQQQLVLYAIVQLTRTRKGIKKLGHDDDTCTLLSGEVFNKYLEIAKDMRYEAISDRWFRHYINELAMYGLIEAMPSGKGQRGNTKLIKLRCDVNKVEDILIKSFG